MDRDFDRRQFIQMRNLIDRLEKNQIGISKFISDQWALLEMLQFADKIWKDDYCSLVNVIEDIYASVLDRGQKQMEFGDIQTIEETLKKMVVSLDAQGK